MRKGRAWAAVLAVALLLPSALPNAPARAAVAPPTSHEQASAVLPSSTDMLRVVNELRYAVGAPTIPEDLRLVAAAQNHATYNVLNNTGGHYEIAGNPGYTGYVAKDRAAAMGFRDSPWVSEVASSARDVLYGVQFLWDAPYHRLGMMHQHTYTVGWGRAAGGPFGYQVIGNLAKDYGRAVPDVVRSPAGGQRDIPTSWNGRESPSPVPAGTSAPYGYPIMLVYSDARAVDLRGASLHHNGLALPFYVAPQVWQRDYQIVVPKDPLPAGTINVRFDLTVAGKWVTQEWSFSTVGAPPPASQTLPSPITVDPEAPAPAPAPTGPAPSVPATPIAQPGHHSAWVSQTAYPAIGVGETATVSVTFRNAGTTTWARGTSTEARLGVVGDSTMFSLLGMAEGWPLPSRPAAQGEATVGPGQTATFTFNVRGVAPGTYLIPLRSVIDGVTWLEDEGVHVVVAVR